MSRVQLALNVSDVAGSVEFYTKLFGVGPHKVRPGYANFEVVDPPLKLVLIESEAAARGHGTAGALNHLGVEVDVSTEVDAAARRLADSGLAIAEEQGSVCCYARQDKVWVHDPAGTPWEVYTVIDDNPSAPTELPVVSAASVDAVVAGDPEGGQRAACCATAP